MKLWGLFSRIFTIACSTQQDFQIGLFAKSDSFHWSRRIYNISSNIHFHQTTAEPHILLMHTYSTSIPHLLYVSLGMCYQRYSTTKKYSHKTTYTPSVGVMRYLSQY